jgi:hypothetical protein
MMAPTPEVFVKSALARLGVYKETYGYWSHDLMAWVIHSLPPTLANKIISGQILAIRKRALKKKAKEQ